ncbi:Conserved_hypothetical protein [Hexamita inflata]|uniref:DUF1764 domain-containing protein n=1 Tax=Hexamita inflata TaxID=28002 RepID=A0AA86PGP0_9EUKA|nr:Conserved hypothetical protein [Hexamita inflata]
MPKFEIKKPVSRTQLSAPQPAPTTTQPVQNSEVKPNLKPALKKKSHKSKEPIDFEVNDLEFAAVMERLKQKPKPTTIISEVLTEEEKVQNQKRDKMEEGLLVFSAEELKIGSKGSGKTALCPFDCDCCF